MSGIMLMHTNRSLAKSAANARSYAATGICTSSSFSLQGIEPSVLGESLEDEPSLSELCLDFATFRGLPPCSLESVSLMAKGRSRPAEDDDLAFGSLLAASSLDSESSMTTSEAESSMTTSTNRLVEDDDLAFGRCLPPSPLESSPGTSKPRKRLVEDDALASTGCVVLAVLADDPLLDSSGAM